MHVFKQHNVLLPSNHDRGKPLIDPKAKGQLFLCPCCIQVTDSRNKFKEHVDEHSFKISATFPSCPSWLLQGVNIAERFREYFATCLEDCRNFFDVDQFFNQLLCLSSILVLQKRAKYESLPAKYFSPPLLEATRQNVLSSLVLPDSLDADLYISIKNTIRDYHENKISNLTARHYLISLAMKKDEAERNVVLAIESLFPALKDLDIGHLRESELAASFVHPLIQALLAYDTEEKVARCTNTLPDNGTDVNRRPDYEVMMYDRYQPSYRTCFGELKGEGSSDTLSIMDFYRLGVFAKLEMVSSNLTGVLCFQALGTSITFYTMVHTDSSIYAFVELATITIPKTKNDIMSVTSILDDLYKIAVYHRTIVKSPTPNTKHPTLPFEFVQGTRKTLPAKRKPSLGSISAR
ncbi:uncharacterized protein BYT42DRAFT_611974 [Radiomyces spectabilis]|uniref:uncharacterized protein n=1 Tax=Radiomyces spectabilis TaxID=64574 RepID=UPI00221EBA7B|nr:uncharacterized protein BYT42DRAFT_611974 [Radiomyces spectabilis]KAI8384256.1 hypothetical protein BYT42DRAFT_611974 [Radiomyces spectabilis]